MTSTAVDYDPTDLAGQAERDAERRRRVVVAESEARDDLGKLLSERWGRRLVRQQLREAGFEPLRNEVRTVFSTDRAQMAFQEGLRVRGLQLVWPMVRMLASGQLSIDVFRKLMTEVDE